MQADDDVPSFQQLVERAQALQHDVEQAEHHGKADDYGDPYDAARIALVNWAIEHHDVLRFFRGVAYFDNGEGCDVVRCDDGRLVVQRLLSPPAAGDRSS